jgi:ELWxxDGT repeat protein
LVNRYTGYYELWRSDGTAGGTYSLSTNLFLNYGDYIVTAGNLAFFTADDDIHGPQVWVSDGTLSGTKMVKNINPGGYGSYPYSLFSYKNEVYFGAYDGSGSYFSYWKTDGTENGTKKIKDITVAYWDYYSLFYSHYYSQYFCQSGNSLFFNAIDFSTNTYDPELWKTNGTTQSTQLVKAINPFYGSYPYNLVDVDGTLFFLAYGTNGIQLWLSSGTEKVRKWYRALILTLIRLIL